MAPAPTPLGRPAVFVVLAVFVGCGVAFSCRGWTKWDCKGRCCRPQIFFFCGGQQLIHLAACLMDGSVAGWMAAQMYGWMSLCLGKYHPPHSFFFAHGNHP